MCLGWSKHYPIKKKKGFNAPHLKNLIASLLDVRLYHFIFYELKKYISFIYILDDIHSVSVQLKRSFTYWKISLLKIFKKEQQNDWVWFHINPDLVFCKNWMTWISQDRQWHWISRFRACFMHWWPGGPCNSQVTKKFHQPKIFTHYYALVPEISTMSQPFISVKKS